MHSFYPRGNSILDMSTRSAKKKEFVPLLFFYCSKALIFFGDPSSQKSPFMFWQNGVLKQSISGLAFF